jgi:hypothetical protein
MSDITAQTLTKAPEEDIPYGMDFRPLLTVSGEVLTGVISVTCTAADGAGGATSDLVLGSPTYSDGTNTVTVRISGGVPGVTYRLKFLVSTSVAVERREDGLLNVVDS